MRDMENFRPALVERATLGLGASELTCIYKGLFRGSIVNILIYKIGFKKSMGLYNLAYLY